MSRKGCCSFERLVVWFMVLCSYVLGWCLYQGIQSMRDPVSPPIYIRPRDKAVTMLTIFTTLSASEEKMALHMNTILNWSQLKPRAIPILYFAGPHQNLSSHDRKLQSFAKKHNWLVREVVPTASGVPGLRTMFVNAQKETDTPYYAYCNSDIVFGSNLMSTLDFVYDVMFSQVLLVGQRTNYNVSVNESLANTSQVELAEPKGSLFDTNAIDYFITTKDGFPWRFTPDFVIGRIGFDNWMIVTAITKNIPVIDVTATLTALHQTGSRGNFEGHNFKTPEDIYINYRLAGRFNYDLGHTKCSQFLTVYNESSIRLVHRQQVEPCATYYKAKWVNPNYFKDAIMIYPEEKNSSTI